MGTRELFRKLSLALWLGVAASATVAACGSEEGTSEFVDPNDDSGSPDPGPGGFNTDSGLDPAQVADLYFDPPTAQLTIDDGQAQSASFTLHAKTYAGADHIVLPESVQLDRPDLATVTPGMPVVATAQGPNAGRGTIHAVFGGRAATATLDITVRARDVGAGIDASIVTALTQPNLPADPAVLAMRYPYDKTVFPLGLNSPLLMWDAPQAGDVYRVQLDQYNYQYDAFAIVGATGQLRVIQERWDHVTASNRGAAPLTLRLYRWDNVGKKAYQAASLEWTIAPASLRGAIYYWTTSNGGHLSRIRPGTGAQPEILNNGKCTGCHGVSADGSTLVAAEEDPGGTIFDEGAGQYNDLGLKRKWISFNLPDGSVRKASNRFAGNVAVNPNGKYVVFGSQKLHLGDSTSGLEIGSTGIDTVFPSTPGNGSMTPAFSPDGKKLVAVEGTGNWYHNLINGRLVAANFDEATLKFSGRTDLVPATSFPMGQRAIAYPSFAPDSSHIAFHVGDKPTGCHTTCDENEQQVADLWIQDMSGAAPVRLDVLSHGAPNVADRNLAYEPTFNPIERGGFYWVVFSSSRDWGNAITGTPNNGKKRLWVGAIDKTIGAIDPSHPPFFLEGQEENTTNMRGFWALAACIPTQGGGSCKAGFECCSGFCDKGKCVDPETIACKPLGAVCEKDEDCCNSGVVKCQGGRCAVPVK